MISEEDTKNETEYHSVIFDFGQDNAFGNKGYMN